MEIFLSILSSALGVSLAILVPIVLVVFIGALFGGMIRVVTQIDDPVITFSFKLVTLVAIMYVFSGVIFRSVSHFAIRVWGGGELYL